MSEAIFPLLGPALIVMVVLPLSALMARLMLSALDFVGGTSFLRAPGVRYWFIVGSSALPLGWFLSAALHQAETEEAILGCILEHASDALCLEPMLFAGTLMGVVSLFAALVLRTRDRGASRIDSEAMHRVERLLGSERALWPLRGRVMVYSDTSSAISTRGLLRPRVVVRSEFLQALDDRALRAALAHELEHTSAYDPLRYFALNLALAVNPFGRRFLAKAAHGWRLSREVQCDREAVSRGALPAPLAHALVVAARPVSRPTLVPHLAEDDIASLRLRVQLLLAYCERLPTGDRPEVFTGWCAMALLILALASPHQLGTEALDALHFGAETAATLVLRGL